MKTYQQLTDQDKTAIIAHYKEHFQSETMAAFNITSYTFMLVLNESGFRKTLPTDQNMTEEEERAIADYFRTHTSLETEEHFNISESRVKYLGAKYGVKKAKAPIKPKGCPIENKLRRMKGRVFLYNFYNRRITDYRVGESEVEIFTQGETGLRFKPIILRKHKFLTAELEREFKVQKV